MAICCLVSAVLAVSLLIDAEWYAVVIQRANYFMNVGRRRALLMPVSADEYQNYFCETVVISRMLRLASMAIMLGTTLVLLFF